MLRTTPIWRYMSTREELVEVSRLARGGPLRSSARPCPPGSRSRERLAEEVSRVAIVDVAPFRRRRGDPLLPLSRPGARRSRVEIRGVVASPLRTKTRPSGSSSRRMTDGDHWAGSRWPPRRALVWRRASVSMLITWLPGTAILKRDGSHLYSLPRRRLPARARSGSPCPSTLSSRSSRRRVRSLSRDARRR